MNQTCQRCHKAHLPGHPQWKCCPSHTTEGGPDWVCDACAVILHPEKAGIVTHAMFGQDGVMPCCGLHRSEALQSDRVALLTEDIVTCTGKKRYREKSDTLGA